jgi:hypothetical protein
VHVSIRTTPLAPLAIVRESLFLGTPVGVRGFFDVVMCDTPLPPGHIVRPLGLVRVGGRLVVPWWNELTVFTRGDGACAGSAGKAGVVVSKVCDVGALSHSTPHRV